MGGAFVAVADDASAAYWNPGGPRGRGISSAWSSTGPRRRPTPAAPDGAWQQPTGCWCARHAAARPVLLPVAAAVLTPGVLPSATRSRLRGVRVDTLVTHQCRRHARAIARRTARHWRHAEVVRGIATALSCAVDRDRDDLLEATTVRLGKGDQQVRRGPRRHGDGGSFARRSDGAQPDRAVVSAGRGGGASCSLDADSRRRRAALAGRSHRRRGSTSERGRRSAICRDRGRIGRKACIRARVAAQHGRPCRTPRPRLGASYAVIGVGR